LSLECRCFEIAVALSDRLVRGPLRGHRHREVPVGSRLSSKQRSKALYLQFRSDRPDLLVPAHHESHVVGKPGGGRRLEPLFQDVEIVSNLADRASERLGPDRHHRLGIDDIGADEFIGFTRQWGAGALAAQEFARGSIADIGRRPWKFPFRQSACRRHRASVAGPSASRRSG
jgi:hypothetical protein